MSVNIGIDLGTTTTLIYLQGKGIVLEEPSVIAIDTVKKEVLAVGDAAFKMLGRTPSSKRAVFPLKSGVISDYGLTIEMLKKFFDKVYKYKIMNPSVVVCLPESVTGVERNAVLNALYEAGARSVALIKEQVAAALGAGIDISKPVGNIVVDIGGGTTDISVISLNGISVGSSIKVAGKTFDEAIIKYVKRKYNVLLGEVMAETVKITIGNVYDPSGKTFKARGRHLLTGLPTIVELSDQEIKDCLQGVADQIYLAVHDVLQETPPELIGDIYENGVLLTGGGALLNGLDKALEEKVKVSVHVADEARYCVAKGTGKALNYPEVLEKE